jgi:hypothetical protein
MSISPALMRTPGRLPALVAVLCMLGAGPAAAQPAAASSYPTVDRVLFVQECMRAHPGSYYEMVNKCSCAMDTLARELPFDDYTTLVTAANAMTIGGERGSVLRDNEAIPAQIKRLRELQAKAKRACFINPETAR